MKIIDVLPVDVILWVIPQLIVFVCIIGWIIVRHIKNG